MPSIPLKHPDDLVAYVRPDTTAHLTIFYNTPAQANQHLVVVFGTTGTGGLGELAHLQMPKEVFDRLADEYPVGKINNLTRSLDFSVQAAYQMLIAYWPPEPPAIEEAN